MRLKSFYSAATLAASALACISHPLGAQGGVSPQCSSTLTQDACQKAIDVFQFLAPQLGAIIAGGNTTLGVGGTLGGLGHVYVSGRATGVNSNFPRVDQVTPSTSGAHSDQYPTQSQFAGIPQADIAIGLFRGFPLGVTNVGGVDLLGSVSYLPSINASGVHLTTPNGSIKFGAGVRVGIVQESILFPGLSVSYLRRGLPTVNLLSSDASGDSLHINDINVTTDSYRIVASKSLMILGLAAGIGEDRYSSSASSSANVAARGPVGVGTPAQSVGPIAMSQKMSRTTYFLDATLDLSVIKVIGEIGRTNAVNIPTFNSFAGSSAGAALTFGALGIRLGL
ncbi:MAG: hypothetical protein M3R65_10520 [Gemmatimonadota bacterium]|nr:hypothetical protein [Gemmatimonadota bacterium]